MEWWNGHVIELEKRLSLTELLKEKWLVYINKIFDPYSYQYWTLP